jgi:hypothetical protein
MQFNLSGNLGAIVDLNQRGLPAWEGACQQLLDAESSWPWLAQHRLAANLCFGPAAGHGSD